MPSALKVAADQLMDRYGPCDEMMFDPMRPFGLIWGDFDACLLNIGVVGAMFISASAETFTDEDIQAVFPCSADRDEFKRWLISVTHTFHRTLPNTGEDQALKMLDERANRDFYRLLGLHVE